MDIQAMKPSKKISKYTVQEVLNSLAYECCDADEDYDGYMHISSDIDGSEIQIKISTIIDEAERRQKIKV